MRIFSKPWHWLLEKLRSISNWLWGYDYFISYHWESGGKYAVALSQLLSERKFDCFLDKTEFVPGDDWREEAARALRGTQRLIVIATREAITISEPVAHEVSLFEHRSRHIIPIRFGDVLTEEEIRASVVLEKIKDSVVQLTDSTEALIKGKPDPKKVVDQLIQTDEVLRRRKLRIAIVSAVMTMLLILAIVASIFGVISEVRRARTDQLRQLAVAESLAQRALRQIDNQQDVELAGYFACLAHRLNRAHQGEAQIASIDEALRAYLAQDYHSLSLPAQDVYAIAVSPNDKLLAAGNKDSTVQVWNLLQPWKEPRILRHEDGTVEDVAFDPTGQFLASAGHDGVRLWKLPDFEPIDDFGHQEGRVSAIEFSPSGKYLLSGGSDGALRLWEMESLGVNSTQYDHEGRIYHLALSGNGRVLAISVRQRGSRGIVRVYQLHEEDGRLELSGEIDRLARNGLALNHDGTQLMMSGVNNVFLYNLESIADDPIHLEHPSSQTYGLVFRKGDGVLATGGMSGEIYLWDLQAPGEPMAQLLGHSSSARSLRFGGDLTTLFSGSRDGTVRIWSSADHSEPSLIGDPDLPVYSLAYSPVGTEMAFGDRRGGVWLWDGLGDPPQQIEDLEGFGVVHAIAFSPDGKKVARVTSRTATVIGVREKNVVAQTSLGTSLRGAVFSSDGITLALAGQNRVFLWQFETTAKPERLRSARPRGMAFDTAGTRLSAATSEGVLIWQRAEDGTWSDAKTLADGEAWFSVAFGSKDQSLIGGSQNGDLAIWLSDSLEAEPTRLRAHRGAVESLSVNALDNTLATIGADRVVRIWNLDDLSRTPLILRTDLPEVDIGSVNVSFRADGAKLAAAGGGQVHVWTSRTDAVAQSVCSQVKIEPPDDATWEALVGVDVPRDAFLSEGSVSSQRP